MITIPVQWCELKNSVHTVGAHFLLVWRVQYAKCRSKFSKWRMSKRRGQNPSVHLFSEWRSKFVVWQVSTAQLFPIDTKNKFIWNYRGPTDNYLFKVNNTNNRTKCKLCSELTIETLEQHHSCRCSSFLVYLILYLIYILF